MIFKTLKIICKKIVQLCLIAMVVLAAVVLISERLITNQSKSFLYDNTDNIPENKAALVLGTAKYLSKNHLNDYYKNRIDAAIALYKAGKIKYIIVSGDNAHSNYNEPQQMKNDLVAGDIPPEVIFLDYAGFRTWDSVVRMNKIFGQTSFTIISQKFHNERAVYIARKNHLEAIAFNAQDVNKYMGLKTQVRERFARIKVFIDFITNKEPKFLGDEIKIDSE
ncbi:MAG: YdcF family protein [Prevotellaceae bacterium]|jgi:SanA protein|nr:YdcF family protein [Prevotellaceae bacterium]